MNRNFGFSKIGIALILVSFFVLGLGCAGMRTAEAQQPSISVSPEQGAKGTPLSITGAGFQPDEEIDITLTLGPGERIGLGTAKLDAVVTDSQGAFTAESAIPVFAKPGKYEVEVEGSKGSVVTTTLEVTP
jgi:hypothetical protein